MKAETLQKLYTMSLKDLYSAEKQLVQALPKMAQAASSPKLAQAFQDHLRETEVHVQRIVQLFDGLGTTPGGHKCKAMEGLIEEGKEIIELEGDPGVKDAGLIAAAQRVEHYEIAAYGCARRFAELLGYDDAVNVLQSTLDEESAADEKLTDVAEGEIYANMDTAILGADHQ